MKRSSANTQDPKTTADGHFNGNVTIGNKPLHTDNQTNPNNLKKLQTSIKPTILVQISGENPFFINFKTI